MRKSVRRFRAIIAATFACVIAATFVVTATAAFAEDVVGTAAFVSELTPTDTLVFYPAVDAADRYEGYLSFTLFNLRGPAIRTVRLDVTTPGGTGFRHFPSGTHREFSDSDSVCTPPSLVRDNTLHRSCTFTFGPGSGVQPGEELSIFFDILRTADGVRADDPPYVVRYTGTDENGNPIVSPDGDRFIEHSFTYEYRA